MPIWLRRYHIEKINDYHRKQEEEQRQPEDMREASANHTSFEHIKETTN